MELNEDFRIEFFDTIVVIIDEETIKSEDYTSYLLRLTEKPNLLLQNIFRLLDCKVNLDSLQFDHLLEQYLKQLDFYVLVANELDKNLLNSFPKIDEGSKFGFSMQAEYFNSHLLELKSKFNVTKDQPKLAITVNRFKDAFPFIKKLEGSSKKEKSTPLKKAKELTNEEIDAFLLQNVFHIDKKHFE
jgi:hypothetical protein